MAGKPPSFTSMKAERPDKRSEGEPATARPISSSDDIEDGAKEKRRENVLEPPPLQRKLKSRHLTMISIGGIIGPGLLVGAGSALATAGPAGALIAFAVTGLIIFNVMQSLGELSTLYPISGSFTTYAFRFVDPALAFALGWIYWELWISVLANELNSVALVLQYWPGGKVVPLGAWIAIFWVIFLGFSLLGVLAYGEVEFWLSTIKILAIFIFFIISIVINVGGTSGAVEPGYIGFRYWGDPGPFADGINGVAKIFVISGTLYAGCEMVGVASGESTNPRSAVPKAIRSVIYRILFFYLGTIFFIGINIPYNNTDLVSAKTKTGASPFTIALRNAGINVAASIMNSVIIISVISAGNSSLYVASRILCSMGREGRAPRFFAHTTRTGVPVRALVFSNAVALISLLNVNAGAGKVFTYLMDISGVSTFITWAVIALCHIRFRRAWKAQGRSLDELPFKALWYPYGAYFALAANIFLCFFQGYTSFLTPFSAVDFVVSYIVLPVFLLLYVGWKVYHRTRIVRLDEVDLDMDKREAKAASAVGGGAGLGSPLEMGKRERKGDEEVKEGEADGGSQLWTAPEVAGDLQSRNPTKWWRTGIRWVGRAIA